MAVGDILEMAFCNFGAAQNCINVSHYKVLTIGATEPTMQEYAQVLGGNYATQIKAIMSAQFSYRGVKARRIWPSTTALIVNTTGTGAGSLAGDPLPAQLTCVATLRASTAPPRVRGRAYLPPPTEAENDNTASPSAAYRVNALNSTVLYNEGVFTVTVGAHTATVQAVLWSKVHLAGYAIDSVSIRTSWGTQRRRSAINRGDTSAV